MASATTSAGTVPAELIAAFRRDGFVVVPGLVTPAELAALAPAITRAATASWPAASEARNVWERVPDARTLAEHEGIASTAAALIGARALRLWCDRAAFDEPGSGAMDAHRDHDRWPIAEARTITAWIPLDGAPSDRSNQADASNANGNGDEPCQGYVPGSHRTGLRHLLGARCVEHDDVLGDTDEDDDVDVEKPVFVEVPPGAVAFHHGLTTHVVRAHDGARVRRSHEISFVADGCTRGPGPAHDSVDRTGIAPGAPIDGPLTPLVWVATPVLGAPRAADRA